MASETSICNRALRKIGANRITSLTDPNSKSARACNELYADSRDALLRAHPWNFAMERVALAPMVATPAFGFDNYFQLPADFIRVAHMEDEEIYDYKVEGRKIATDIASVLNLVYIKRVTDTSQFDALFVDALASYLAWQLAETLTQSNTKKAAAKDDFILSLRIAKNADGQEGTSDEIPDTNWITVRN